MTGELGFRLDRIQVLCQYGTGTLDAKTVLTTYVLVNFTWYRHDKCRLSLRASN